MSMATLYMRRIHFHTAFLLNFLPERLRREPCRRACVRGMRAMASRPAGNTGSTYTGSHQKVYKTALCFIPPSFTWQQLQLIRCFNDKSFVRWPPHINLLYPFVEDEGDNFKEAAAAIAEALARTQPFQITLKQLDFFEHGRSCTLWCDPESPELLQLQAVLQTVFPWCSDLSNDPARGITQFQPHMSLGQWRKLQQVVAAMQDYLAAWQPLTLPVAEVALISRKSFDDPFTIRYTIPLGGALGSAAYTQPQQLDVPYVASIPSERPAPTASAASSGPCAAATTPSEERFGLGGSTAGIFNFAFGANMCPRKLSSQSRQLSPLSSRPARLQGYRLAFNHRGGFGNLVPLQQGELGPSGLAEVHGVLHALTAEQLGRLSNMEHEYWPLEVLAEPYDGSGPVTAVAYVSPPERTIAGGLPPIARYMELLKEGAAHWQLHPQYTAWLNSISTIEGSRRGPEYYSSADGQQLQAWLKTRTGSDSAGGKRGDRRGRGGSGGSERGQRGGRRDVTAE